MAQDKKFAGFSKDAVQFMEDLVQNNDKEWFAQNRDQYKKYVLEPARDFVAAMGEKLQTIAPGVIFDMRANGAGSIFRIYRDVRFTKDKSPYKTHLGILFWEGDGKKMENPGFYFQLEPPNVMLGAGMYCFTRPQMEIYRQAVAAPKTGKKLLAAVKKVQKAGDFSIGGAHYKRQPRGFEAPENLQPWMLHNGLYGWVQEPIPDEFYSEKLLDWCLERWKAMQPIQNWLKDAVKSAE